MNQSRFEVGDRVQIKKKSMYLFSINRTLSRAGVVVKTHYPVIRDNHRITIKHDSYSSPENPEQIWHASHVEREDPLQLLADISEKDI